MIKVLFFAKLREELRINELDIEYKAEVASIRNLISYLRQEYSKLTMSRISRPLLTKN